MALTVSADVRSLLSSPVQSKPVPVLFGIPLERLPAPRMRQVPATGPLASIRALARSGALDANPREECRVTLAPFTTEPIIQLSPARQSQIRVWNFLRHKTFKRRPAYRLTRRLNVYHPPNRPIAWPPPYSLPTPTISVPLSSSARSKQANSTWFLTCSPITQNARRTR